MSKISLKKPVLVMLYGFPGSGKTYFASRLAETLQTAYVSGDRIRGELFEKPRYDKAEDAIVQHLAEYMSEEFLSAGISVILDANADRLSLRRSLRSLAQKRRAKTLLIWFQIDADSAFARLGMRDKRKSEEKFSRSFTKTGFEDYASKMQHPTDTEDYVVLSGKHSWPMQRSTLLRKLFDLNLVS